MMAVFNKPAQNILKNVTIHSDELVPVALAHHWSLGDLQEGLNLIGTCLVLPSQRPLLFFSD